MATPQKVPEYELKRLENIRRNKEMLSALQIHSKASQLSKAVTKPEKKKLKTETPIAATRSSLRIRGIPALILETKPLHQTMDPLPMKDACKDIPALTLETKPLHQTMDPLPMKDAYEGMHSDRSFVESLADSSMSNKEQVNGPAKNKKKIECSLELESLSLDCKNIARVVPDRITHVRFLPSNDFKMVVAGNRFGNIGFWNVGESEVFVYHPHQTPISGIVVHPHCLSKIYTSCNDGFVRMMDAEKEVFDMVYQSSKDEDIYSKRKKDRGIYALSQPKNDANCLYLAEGSGCLTVWDNRIGKCSSSSFLVLHRLRINTIDFNPENPHIAVTSSSDGTACTWDFRCIGGMGKGNLTALRKFTYEEALQSAYFSPSGRSIAITSSKNTIGIYSGVNLEDATFVYHERIQTFSTFRAIWGWDDSYIFTGSEKKGVDVVSAVQKATVMTLESPLISAIPLKFGAHSYEVGMLAGGTCVGLVYVWTLN